jgi:hypothetical protein
LKQFFSLLFKIHHQGMSFLFVSMVIQFDNLPGKGMHRLVMGVDGGKDRQVFQGLAFIAEVLLAEGTLAMIHYLLRPKGLPPL